MSTQAIFGIQFALSLFVWALVVGSLLKPWLKSKPASQALVWLILPHAFRHIGLVFLVPGVVSESLPGGFATPAAYGDLVAGLLALVAIFALRSGLAAAPLLVWIFNIVGTVDLINALRHSEAIGSLDAAWFIPTFFVPLLLVTHVTIFSTLVKHKSPNNTA
jgi:hypothetical protein